MINKLKIPDVVGSLRKDSYNHLALKAAQELVPEDATIELIELNGIPTFNQDDEMLLSDSVLHLR